MPSSPSALGFVRMDAKPPLFSSERSPVKSSVPCSVRLNPPLETPPITPSFTEVQEFKESSVSKEARFFSAAGRGELVKSATRARVPIQARVFRNAVIVFMDLDGLWGGWGCALTSKVLGYPLLVTFRIQESPDGSHFHLLAPHVRPLGAQTSSRETPFRGRTKEANPIRRRSHDREATERESRRGHPFPKPQFLHWAI